MAVTYEQLEDSIIEAERFVVKAKEARELMIKEHVAQKLARDKREARTQEAAAGRAVGTGYIHAEHVPGVTAAKATVRRASMDLTRSLANLRKY